MKFVKSTDVGVIYKLDDEDKRRDNTECDYFIGNGHFSLYGNSVAYLQAEMARCMSITRPRIY